VTHEHLANSEHSHGPEGDHRLPDARSIATFADPGRTNAPPLLADLDTDGDPFTSEEILQLDESVRESVDRGEL
jgi:hypothetical protein